MLNVKQNNITKLCDRNKISIKSFRLKRLASFADPTTARSLKSVKSLTLKCRNVLLVFQAEALFILSRNANLLHLCVDDQEMWVEDTPRRRQQERWLIRKAIT